jgi:hypothetical protein
MMPREMTPLYIPNSGFHPPKIDGLLPHFLVLHRMMRKTLAPRIGYSDAIPTYERNLLDTLMKPVRFNVFEYIMDEIWNIATNLLRSCGFAPYIQHMIKVVTMEKFYKDSKHEPLRPVVPKDPRTHRASSLAPVAPRTTRSDGASSVSSTNSGFLKMLRDIFVMCQCMNQRMDIMEQRLQIMRHNQEIIHSQWDEPLLEFPDVHVFPPIPDPYASLTPVELVPLALALLVFLTTTMMRRRPTTTRRWRMMSS